MIRKTVYYEGHVQGVGFRMTVHRLAGRYPVHGYVRNCPDGRVELVAEGAAGNVDALIKEVDRSMDQFIRDTKIDESSATGEFNGFAIRY